MNYYEHHLGDYLRKTHHLTLLEHGVYRMLLDKYYINEKPLPADLKTVQRLVGARTDEERQTVETILKEYFELTEDGWRNAKCDEEIGKAQSRMETARNNGKRGGRPPKAKQETETEAKTNPEETQRVILGSDLETQPKALHFPSPISQPPVKKEDANASLASECARAFELFNRTADRCQLPRAQNLNDDRKRKLRQRLSECGGLPGWEVALAKLEASDWCCGRNGSWRADLDFLLQAKSFTKLMEGSYDNRTGATTAKPNVLRSRLSAIAASAGISGNG